MILKNLFSKHYFKTQWKHHLPVLFIYTLLMFLGLPLVVLLLGKDATAMRHFKATSTIVGNFYIYCLVALVSALLGLLYHYLFKVDSINHMHSLPLTRKQLFFTNLVLGFILLTLPVLFNYSLTLIFAYMSPFTDNTVGIMDYISLMIQVIFISCTIFALSACISMVSSSFFVQLILIGSMIFIPVTTIMVIDQVILPDLIFGFASGSIANESLFLCPMAWFFTIPGLQHGGSLGNGPIVYDMTYLKYAIPCFILSVLLGYHLYKKRHLESVHNWVAFKWVNVTLKVIAFFIGGVFLSVFLKSVVSRDIPLLVYMLVGGFIGYFIVAVFLEKKLNVFRTWKTLLLSVAFVLVFYVGAITDLGGLTNHVPDATEVKSIDIRSDIFYDLRGDFNVYNLTTPEDIQTVIEMHEYILKHRDEFSKVYQKDTLNRSIYVRINYLLNDDSHPKRNYDLYMNEENFIDLAKIAYNLEPVLIPIPEYKDDIAYNMYAESPKDRVLIGSQREAKELIDLLRQDYANMSFEDRYYFKYGTNEEDNKIIMTYNYKDEDGIYDRHMNLDFSFSSSTPLTYQWLKEKGYLEKITLTLDDISEVIYRDGEGNNETITDKATIQRYFNAPAVDFKSSHNQETINIYFQIKGKSNGYVKYIPKSLK